MSNPEQNGFARRSRRRLIWTVLVAALLGLVIVPSAAAIRFTDDSYQVPDGAVGSRYFHQFKGDGGCGPALPYQFRILNGALPPGLSLASNGLVSGTQGGNWSFWVSSAIKIRLRPTGARRGSRSVSSRSTSARRASPMRQHQPRLEAADSRSPTRVIFRLSATSAMRSPRQ